MKNRFKILLPLLALSWMIFAAQPALAQSTQAELAGKEGAVEAYGVSCSDGICTVDVSLERLNLSPITTLGAAFAIEVLEENLKVLPESAGLEIDDSLTFRFPAGELPLANANLLLTLDEDGQVERLRGTADLPFPGTDLLDTLDLDAGSPLRADIGLEFGENLAHLQAPLDAQRRYLFLDLHSGLGSAGSSTRATVEERAPRVYVPRGQDATLIIDLQEPYAYLAGTLSFSMDDQLAFVEQVIDFDGVEALLPDGLPIRERVGVEVATSVGQGAEPFLRVGGSYSMDARMVGRLLGTEIMPLAARGMISLDGAGLLLDAVAESRIAPNLLFAGSTAAALFVPFQDLSAAYAQLSAEGEIPFAATSVEAMARLDGETGIIAQASVTTPLSGDADAVAIVDSGREGDGNRSMALVRSLADGAGNTATRSFLYVRNYAGSGVDALADGADAGLYWSARAWCNISGRCDPTADAVAVAE